MRDVADILRYCGSPRELMASATARRRTAGGIRTALQFDKTLGAKDQEVLTKAISLLGRMADTFELARDEARKRERLRAERELEARRLVEGALAGATSILDRVAFVVAVNSYLPRGIRHVADLDRVFADAKRFCAFNLTQDSADLPGALAKAWDKFEVMRPMLRRKYAGYAEAMEQGAPTPPA